MVRLLTFDPSDLVVDMPKPEGYDNLLGEGKLAAKHSYLRDIFGAQNLTFVGYEHGHKAQRAPNPIRVHTIYAIFEVTHWPAKEVERQQRLTVERIAKVCRPSQAKSNKRGFEELYDDELPVAIVSADEVHTSNAKKRKVEGKRPTFIEQNPKETLQLSEQNAQVAQGRASLSAPRLGATSGAVKELESDSKKERIAAGIAQACAVLSHAAQKIRLEEKVDGSAAAQNREPNQSRFAMKKRKTIQPDGYGSILERENGFATPQESHQAFAREVLVRYRDKSIIPLNNARFASKAGNGPPQPIQRIQGSREHTARTLDLFLKTETVQNPRLVIDEVTGVASVVQAGDSEKALKRKQQVETLPSRKKPKRIDAQQATSVVTLRDQSMLLPCLVQRAANGGFSATPSVAKHLFSEVEAEAEWNMAVTPANLVLSSPTSSLEPTSNTPTPNGRGNMDVAEAFKAHGYNIVSEEDRAESLLRHRLANRELLGERSSLRDAGMGSVRMDDFFYVTPFEFDGFRLKDKLEVLDDAALGLDLNSRGLRKW